MRVTDTVPGSRIASGHGRRAAAALLLCASLPACDGPRRAAADGLAAPLRCEDLALAAASAPPLASVSLSGVLPSSIDMVQAMATAAGDSVGSPVALRGGEVEGVDMIVPVHPDGRLDGGHVQLRFAGGDVECEPLPFTIAPLQPAPGTLRQVAGDLQTLLDTHLHLLGGSTAALRAADPDTLVPPLALLFLAQALIDGPDNPGSLWAALERHAADLEAGTDALALADALLGGTAFHEDVRTRPRNALREASEPQVREAALNAASRVFRLASYQEPGFTLPDAGGCSYPSGEAFTRPDAETLSCWMRLALYGELATTGTPAQTFTALSATLAAGAALPSHPVVREGFSLAAAAALAYALEMDAFAHLLPRRFVPNSLEFDLHPASFNEDDPGPGHWDNARIEAQSEGWTADLAVLDVVMHATGVQVLQGLVAREVASYATAEGGMVEIPPQRFGPVDITDEQWTDARISGMPVQHDLAAGRPFYRPNRVGESVIRVSTTAGRFGVEHQAREEALGVEAIRVVLTPRRVHVKPGDHTRIHVEVENADDTRVKWEIEPAAHRLIIPGPNAPFVEVVTSARMEDLPATLTATSMADRSHLGAAPERVGTARLLTNALALDPGGACVRPGDRLRFTVTRPDIAVDGIVFEGGMDPSGEDYRWSASVGSVDRRGEFVAPSTNGTATITAVDREDPALRGEVEVRFGEQCNSWFSYSAIGGLALDNSGSLWGFMGIRRPPAGECHLSIPLGPGPDADNTLTLVALLPDGLQPGTYRVAPSFTGDPDANVGSPEGQTFSRLWISSGSLEHLSPGEFHAELQADARYGSDDRSDAFVSRGGTVWVKEFDGSRIAASFSIDMVQTSVEGDWVEALTPDAERLLAEGYPFGSDVAKRLGRERIEELRAQYARNPPRRSTMVSGDFSHLIEGKMSRPGKLPDFYSCTPSDSEAPQ